MNVRTKSKVMAMSALNQLAAACLACSRALLSGESPIAKVTLQKGHQIEEAIACDETFRVNVKV